MENGKLSKEELELYKSFEPNTIGNCQNYLRLLSDVYFEMTTETQIGAPQYEIIQKYYAKTTMQMFFMKALATIRLLDGVGYMSERFTLPLIQDPSLLCIITRNFCETIAAYEVLFLLPDTKEKRIILENLFLGSGYRYQARLFSESMQTNFVEEYDIVNQNVQNTKANIISTQYYKSLSSEQQTNLKNAISSKNYKVMLLDNEVKFLSWQDSLNLFAGSNELMDRIYTFLSFHTHPSIRGMEQFDAAFEKVNPGDVSLCTTGCQYIISFMSMFLQEYIKLFPRAKEIFDSKSDFEKWLLTMHDYRKHK